MVTYGSLALMEWHSLSIVVLAWIWGGLFALNMGLKEVCMSRYPEWDQYKRDTRLLLRMVI